jgi:hypothetical protein
MLRRAAELVRADKVLFVSHSPEVQEMADSRIMIGQQTDLVEAGAAGAVEGFVLDSSRTTEGVRERRLTSNAAGVTLTLGAPVGVPPSPPCCPLRAPFRRPHRFGWLGPRSEPDTAVRAAKAAPWRSRTLRVTIR